VILNVVSAPVLAAHTDRRSPVAKPPLSSGVDLMDVARLEREVARRGDSLIEELLSADERGWCRRRKRAVEGYAMAYAAKEALFKALGTGKVGRMAWGDIVIGWPEGSARPEVALSGETAAVAGSLGVAKVHLAMAATRAHAMAWVILT
jgi:holo-[acyl-carrier protein] synthase